MNPQQKNSTEQCAKVFEDNGRLVVKIACLNGCRPLLEMPPLKCFDVYREQHSNIQLHKFLRKEAAEKVLLAIKAADKRDKLGYQVCVLAISCLCVYVCVCGPLSGREMGIKCKMHQVLFLIANQWSTSGTCIPNIAAELLF